MLLQVILPVNDVKHSYLDSIMTLRTNGQHRARGTYQSFLIPEATPEDCFKR